MVEYLVDDNHLDYDREDIRFIQDLIEGHPSPYAAAPRSFRVLEKLLIVA
jgi:hypothetical protein